MESKPQWSIKRMLLLVFIAGLIFSHLPGFFEKRIEGFTDFTVQQAQIEEWISEVDPSVFMFTMSGHISGPYLGACDSESDYEIWTENVDANRVFDHVHQSLSEKAISEGWTINKNGKGGSGFSMVLTNGVTRFKIFCWKLPTPADPVDGKVTARIKLVQAGYEYR